MHSVVLVAASLTEMSQSLGSPTLRSQSPRLSWHLLNNVTNLSIQPGLVSQACDLLLSGKLRQQDLEFKGGLTVIV